MANFNKGGPISIGIFRNFTKGFKVTMLIQGSYLYWKFQEPFQFTLSILIKVVLHCISIGTLQKGLRYNRVNTGVLEISRTISIYLKHFNKGSPISIGIFRNLSWITIATLCLESNSISLKPL